MKYNQIDAQVFLPEKNNIEYLNRDIRENKARINNINNELIQIALKEKLNPKNIKINFFREFNVSNEDFEKAKEISEQLLNSFNINFFLDILSLEKLLSVHKHLMELFNYIVYLDQNFDWINFRKKLNYQKLINRMKNINYELLSPKQFNFYLNRFLPNMNLPKLIPLSSGMNHIFKWIKCQMTIYIYLINSKQLNNSKIKNTSTIISNRNQSTSIDNISFNNHSQLKSLNINQNENNKKNEIIETSDLDNIMITNLPLNNISSKKNSLLQNPKSTREKVVSKNLISLFKYNVFKDKKKKEEKVIKYLPLLNNRTFGQMRKYYNIKSDLNDRYYQKQHLQDIGKFTLSGISDKSKIISMLKNNKIHLIGELLPKEKLDEILQY